MVHAIIEARRAAPAVLFLPHLQLWWETAPASLRATLWMLLADLPPDLPLLLFATADAPLADLDPEALALFGGHGLGVAELKSPDRLQREAFFEVNFRSYRHSFYRNFRCNCLPRISVPVFSMLLGFAVLGGHLCAVLCLLGVVLGNRAFSWSSTLHCCLCGPLWLNV